MTSAFKLALYGVIILSIIGGVFFVYNHVKGLGVIEEKVKVSDAVIRQTKNYEKRKQKNNSSDDVDLIKRYCRWVYGTTYNECVSSYKPVDRK